MTIQMTWWAELEARVPPLRGEGEPIKVPREDAAILLGDAVSAKAKAKLGEAHEPREHQQVHAKVLGDFWRYAIEHAGKTMGARVDRLLDRWVADFGATWALGLVGWLPIHGGKFEIGGMTFGLTVP